MKLVEEYLPSERVASITAAYDFAKKAHQGQFRESGEPYLEHPVQTALILAQLQLDTNSISAALLHDVPENCDIPVTEIEQAFGGEIAKLVDGVTKLGKLSLSADTVAITETQMENLRKMLLAMAEDLRVVFIKLADRLHNMRTLDALSPEKQRRIALETMEIYAPLSHRLGVWELKWQLEDLSFRHLNPVQYQAVASLITARRAEREKLIDRVIQKLDTEFIRVGLEADISGRPKHIYSIHQKIEKYAAQGKNFDDIHDLLALRVLVGTVADCYSAVGIIHSSWHPLPGEFDDYIANPKPNGYQSLHTTVIYEATPLEIQIRTHEMRHIAEYGVAAHWRYKEGDKRDIKSEEKIGWLRQLIEWHRELSGAEEFLESVKTDIFIDQVFVYTPKGEIKDLPKGSTPLDFAYRIHTELGHRCIGAKVNGRLVPLNYQLANGDKVEVMASKGARAPSRDWLNPQLGYVSTSHARGKIRQWFRKQERTENVEHGREILDKEMRRLGIKLTERDELAKLFKFQSTDEFLASVGYGGISIRQIAAKLSTQPETPKEISGISMPKQTVSTVKVLGVGDMLTHLAQCCHPVPGDEIIGYITRNRGVSIHRRDCQNILHEDEQERLVPVEWGRTDSLYPVSIRVEVWDRVGLMRDITTIVAEEKVNIKAASSASHGNHTVSAYFTIEISDLTQLSRLLGKIEGISGVINVTRVGDEAASKTSSPAPRKEV
ncbi:RelA/SpoT family protein [Chloroflexota bacterium]